MADTKYFIIGGGASSAKAAVAIRAADKEGRVILVSREDRFPYDRPPLSKDLLQKDSMTAEDPESKDPSWFTNNNVEIRKGVGVIRIDRRAHRVELTDDTHLTYEKLVLATGSSAVHPNIPGSDLENVFVLRTVDDALRIRSAIQKGGRAVMIGGGYIGMEVAASATARGIHCTITERGKRPWAHFGSQAASSYVQGRYEEEGVVFRFEETVESIVGEGKVSSVRTQSGAEVPADFVVIGVGVKLNNELAVAAGLTTDPSGGVVVNEFLRSEDPDIYVAGDVAAYVDKYTGERMHVEHHMNAGWTGATAGSNMAGGEQPFDKVAYFYSDAFDIHMALRGTPGGELCQTIGDVASGNFVELYKAESGKLRYGLAVNREESKLDPISDKLETLIMEGALAEQIHPDDFALLV